MRAQHRRESERETRDEIAKQRFLQEAQAASALDHPNICTIYEINETDDGQLYLVMAHYEGETLKERIGRGPLPVDEAVGIATQVVLSKISIAALTVEMLGSLVRKASEPGPPMVGKSRLVPSTGASDPETRSPHGRLALGA